MGRRKDVNLHACLLSAASRKHPGRAAWRMARQPRACPQGAGRRGASHDRAGGIMPTSVSEVLAQRAQLRDIIYSTWPACTAPDPEHADRLFRVHPAGPLPPAFASCR